MPGVPTRDINQPEELHYEDWRDARLPTLQRWMCHKWLERERIGMLHSTTYILWTMVIKADLLQSEKLYNASSHHNFCGIHGFCLREPLWQWHWKCASIHCGHPCIMHPTCNFIPIAPRDVLWAWWVYGVVPFVRFLIKARTRHFQCSRHNCIRRIHYLGALLPWAEIHQQWRR